MSQISLMSFLIIPFYSAEEPMESIVQARYTNFATDDQDYPHTAVIATKVVSTAYNVEGFELWEP